MVLYGVIVYLVYYVVCFRHMAYLVSRTPDLHNWGDLLLLVHVDHKRV